MSRPDRSNRLSVFALGYVDIGNPVPLSTRKTRFLFLTIKICRLLTQAGEVKVIKGVDVYDGIEPVGNLTGHNRHRATAHTHVKCRGLRSEYVPRNGILPLISNR